MLKWLIYAVAGLAGMLVLGSAVLFGLGLRSGAGRIHAAITIDRSPERVWPWLTQPEKQMQWVSWLVSVEENGATQVWIMEDHNNNKQRMRLENTVTAEQPPHKLGVTYTSPEGFHGDQRFSLSPLEGARTRLEIENRVVYESAFVRLLEPLVTPSATNKLVMDLETLKRKVEAEPSR